MRSSGTVPEKSGWMIPFLIALGVLAFYWRVLLDHQTFVFVDASRFFYPLWKWGSGVMAQGSIPLWNPDAQFGNPYLADPQMACAYPPLFLFYSFLGPVNAFNALVLFHHFWALLGFWVFARKQGFSTPAALLGSFIFGFSLHLVCSSWTPVALMTISWIPWVFLAGEKVFRGEKGGFLFLSLAWAMQFAAGYPVLVYLTAIGVGAHFLWRTIFLKKGEAVDWKWFPFLLGAGVVAVVYNLVWGLPFLEMMGYSNYENGAIRYHDLGWWDFATILNPFDQGHPLYSNYHGPHYWVSTFFIGLPALGLLIWGFSRRVFQKTSWGLLLIFLVLSLGVLNVGHLLGKIVPGMGLVVHSGFWLSLLVFWAAWMSAEASEVLVLGPAPKSGQFLWGGLLIGLGMMAFVLAPVLMPIPWALSLAAGLALLFLKDPRIRWWALGTSLFLSLIVPAQSLNILLDREYYESTPLTLQGLKDPGRLFFTPPLLARSTHLQGTDMKEAYEGAKTNAYPNWPLAYGREETSIYNTLQLRSTLAWTFQAFQVSDRLSRDILDYLGVRYLFGKSRLAGLVQVSDQPLFYRVPKPSPKWFAARQAFPEGDSVEVDLTKADKKTIDLARDCFVEDGTKAGSYSARKVVFSASDPNHLALEAPGHGKALVISSESAYPGWKVWVNFSEPDGWGGRAWHKGNLLVVNHAFRGIVLENGETLVKMFFQPVTFRLGLFFTILVIGVWTFLIGKGFLRVP